MTSKEDNDINENQIKIMILGNSSVGKTSFIIKCTEDCFQEVYLSTIGIDYKEKEVIIEGKKYKIFLNLRYYYMIQQAKKDLNH